MDAVSSYRMSRSRERKSVTILVEGMEARLGGNSSQFRQT